MAFLHYVVFILFVLISDAQSECQRGWFHFGNSCYFISNSHKSWANAASFCRAYHSELASVETGAENDFITDTITRIKNGFTKQRRLEQCGDKLDNCFNYDDNECVGKYAPWAKINCAYRCGYCPGNFPPCEDKIDYCKQLVSDACSDNQYSGFVRLNCRKTCNKCTVPALTFVNNNSTLVPSTELSQTKTNALNTAEQTNVTGCVDTKDNCWNYDDSKCLGIYSPWAKLNCPYRCGYCPDKPPCVDKIPNCDEYPANVCTYSGWCRINCRKYCNKCDVPYHANITESHKPLTLHTKSPLRLNTTSLPMLSNGDGFWIGGTDEVIEGVWVWAASGKPLTYSNFYKSVLNIDKNANPNGENCLEIVQWTGNVGKWNDNNCSEESHFICEMEYPASVSGIFG
ncbi:uncharacterized protein [Mytilus edulis]|uniref:uncharacterized protein n=1 Tax=Mytilus edulis TaxID=6550 RepID=UPI0039F0DD40